VNRPETIPAQWQIHAGHIDAQQVVDVAHEIAVLESLTVDVDHEDGRVSLVAPDGRVEARWRTLAQSPPRTLRHQLPAVPQTEVLLSWQGQRLTEVARRLSEAILDRAAPYSEQELDGIVASMPLVEQFSKPAAEFEQWAVIFRDHYVENSVGFLLGMERAGVPPEWIYALSKGDRTRYRDRVHATFRQRGYRSDVLDNAAIDGALVGQFTEQVERVTCDVVQFIEDAHVAGRKVLVIDDGGLIAQGHGAAEPGKQSVDAAIELTVSGLKRIRSVGELSIPIFNLARSALKGALGYPEIADSCVRRLRELLPSHKFIGRPVLVLGYGELGGRVAVSLRQLGCQVSVVDTDTLTLIEAAEQGFAGYRTTAEALREVTPFLVVSVTGEVALTAEDLDLLPHGTYLAGFATRDFSVLTDPANHYTRTEIPGVGTEYVLADDQRVVMLGDGRSLNLFESDAIPNEGYDAYRAGTLIAARVLCGSADGLPPGVHVAVPDEAIATSGLYDAYFQRYLTARPVSSRPEGSVPRPLPVVDHAAVAQEGPSACVVGYGVAGRMHARIMQDMGHAITVIDPKHQDLPREHVRLAAGVAELPENIVDQVRLWSICAPTPEHLPVLRAVLSRDPAARVLLEKPACQSHEIDELESLLAAHPRARILVNDQYRFASVLPVLSDKVSTLEPDSPMARLSVVFTKDRRADIARGRFIDRGYGVLGYEWLHMLAVLRSLLPDDVMTEYLTRDVAASEMWATYDTRLFVSALMERTVVSSGTRVDLYSSIVQPSMPLGLPPGDVGDWQRATKIADERYRHVTIEAGETRFVAQLDPVTAPGGWQLPRNHYRVTAERRGQLLHDEVIHDSPLETSIRDAVDKLLSPDPVPAPELQPLRRIGALATSLRTQRPSVHAPAAAAGA